MCAEVSCSFPAHDWPASITIVALVPPACSPAAQPITDLCSRYSSMPMRPHSRPKPESGETAVRAAPVRQCAIDAHTAGACLRGNLTRSLRVPAPDATRESIRRIVGDRDRVCFVLERDNHDDRPEDLLARDTACVIAGEYRRTYGVADARSFYNGWQEVRLRCPLVVGDDHGHACVHVVQFLPQSLGRLPLGSTRAEARMQRSRTSSQPARHCDRT